MAAVGDAFIDLTLNRLDLGPPDNGKSLYRSAYPARSVSDVSGLRSDLDSDDEA